MRTSETIPNLHVDDIEAAGAFFGDVLGLTDQEMGLDWVTRWVDDESGAAVQLVTQDATAPEDSVVTVKVDDVEAAYAAAQTAGHEIVHPLTDEPWGITRFFVRVPGGAVINVAQHRT